MDRKGSNRSGLTNTTIQVFVMRVCHFAGFYFDAVKLSLNLAYIQHEGQPPDVQNLASCHHKADQSGFAEYM